MCVIIEFQPGEMIPKEKLKFACWNNPDGFGLITKDPKNNNKMDIIRDLQWKKDKNKAENDYEYIYELLEEKKHLYRVLHLRHTTVGTTSLENLHPFPVMINKSQTIYMMHNGTIYEYKQYAGQEQDRSDTINFAEKFVGPFLQRFVGDKGRGDITDPMFKQIVSKFMGTGTHNRLCFVSKNHPTLFIGDWTDIIDKVEEDTGTGKKTKEYKYKASNNTYFDSYQRGGSTGRSNFQGYSSSRGYQPSSGVGSAWDRERQEANKEGTKGGAKAKSAGGSGTTEKRKAITEGTKEETTSPINSNSSGSNVVPISPTKRNETSGSFKSSEVKNMLDEGPSIEKLKDVVLGFKKPFQDITFPQLNRYTNFSDMYETPEGLGLLANLGYAELEGWIIASPEEAVPIISWVLAQFEEVSDENIKLREVLDELYETSSAHLKNIKNRDKIIADLRKDIEQMSRELKKVG